MARLKKFLPTSLLGRSLLIIVTPLVLLQVVSAIVFFNTHWDKVTARLARDVAGDIAFVVDSLRDYRDAPARDRLFALADANLDLDVALKTGEILPNQPPVPAPAGSFEQPLAEALAAYLNKPIQIDTAAVERQVVIRVQLPEGVLEVTVPRKRLFSSTTYVFVIWMVGTSLILFGVATIFMRNQVRPIRKLAFAADAFGKGRDIPAFKPEGAKEVRQAAAAFESMRQRIQRQISERTQMLAGVSHDLRTPLTRMRLQLALLEGVEGSEELKEDVAEMERMLEGYLAFARGAGTEPTIPTNLTALLNEVVAQARRKGGAVDLHTEGEITAPLKPNAFKRCLTNLVDNAIRYARHVAVRAGRRGEAIEVTIDDDGPGIPAERREEVFRPFFRLEGSRNPGTGGVGLGLTIARDVMRGHGGDITLADSPAGGLRVRLKVPL